MASRKFRESFDRLAEAEARFLRSEFLAPAVGRGEVRVRIAGVVCRLTIEPASFRGWGIFHPTSASSARLVREAGLADRRRYLELFPGVQLILSSRREPCWRAAAAHGGDQRIRVEGLVPVRLVEDAERFDVVRTRFDGSHFWFDGVEPRADPATAAWLREALARETPVDALDRPGLSGAHRIAYAAALLPPLDAGPPGRAQSPDDRLREALGHAGAELIDALERRDGYRVTYLVDGQRHVTAVSKDDLTVETAGICLSGRDHDFDLQSLVGVIREGDRLD